MNGDPAMWLNEYHADYLVRDRLAEARRAATRRHLLAALRRRRSGNRHRLPAALAGLGRRLRTLL